MITIKTDYDTNAKRKYMLADFSRDTENSVVITNVRMDDSKRWNKMEKNKQRAVKQFLKENGNNLDIKHGSKIVLVFSQDKSEVEVKFQQKQERER